MTISTLRNKGMHVLYDTILNVVYARFVNLLRQGPLANLSVDVLTRMFCAFDMKKPVYGSDIVSGEGLLTVEKLVKGLYLLDMMRRTLHGNLIDIVMSFSSQNHQQ